MAETQGVVGLGSLLKVATSASPSNYQTVGECKDLALGGESVEFAEFTHQQSPSNYREYKPTFKNGGDLTTTFNWTDDAQQATLKTAFNASQKLYFQVVYPNGKTDEFTAYVANIGKVAPLNGALRKNLTLRISGEIAESDSPSPA